jgi:hypothetical protein
MIIAQPGAFISVLLTAMGRFTVTSASTLQARQFDDLFPFHHPICSDIFGSPIEQDCRNAVLKIPKGNAYYDDEEAEFDFVTFWGPRSMNSNHGQHLPMYFQYGE